MRFDKQTIDSHMHIYKWFTEDGKTFINAIDELQAQTNIKGLGIASLVDGDYGGVDINIMAAIYKLHNPTAYAFGGLYFPRCPITLPFDDGLDPKSQYDELMRIGFDGIKLFTKPDVEKVKKFPICNEAFNDFFDSAERDNTYILWHVSDPKANWSPDFKGNDKWNYSDGSYPSNDEIFKQVFDVLERHPMLNACFAHFFFLSDEPQRLAGLLDKYKNIAVDVVPGTMFRDFEKKSEFYREFLTKYADRIIYGSDSGIGSNPKCEELMTAVYNGLTTDKVVDIWGYKSKGIALPDEACDKILSKTFEKHCGKAPRAVNKIALKTYIEKYFDYIKVDEHKKQIEEFAKTL